MGGGVPDLGNGRDGTEAVLRSMVVVSWLRLKGQGEVGIMYNSREGV